MKNRLAWIVALCFLVSGASLAGAEETAGDAPLHGKMSVGARAGYVQFEGGDYYGQELELDPSGLYGVHASYFVWKDVSVEGAVEYGEYRLNLKAAGNKLAGEIGTLKQLGFLCTIRYQPIMIKDVMPYVGVGAGYYVNSFDHFVKGLDVNVKDDFGFHVAAGGDYHAFGPVWLTLDMRYVWAKTQEEAADLPDPQDISLDSFQAFVGMKLAF